MLTITDETVAFQVPLTDIHPLSVVVRPYDIWARSKRISFSRSMILKSKVQVGMSTPSATGDITLHIALAW